MDWVEGKERVSDFFKKYRYVLIVLLIGILLMNFPEQADTEPSTQPVIEETLPPDLQESLSEILSQVSGAGKVEVLLTEAAGEQTIYQTDEDISGDSIRRETVLVTNADREEKGLVKQITPPTYQGAIIICQGADSASVRLSLTEAVISVTGLTSDRITVLKMK